MKIKNKILVVVLLLISCITTMCFATSIDSTNKTLDEQNENVQEQEKTIQPRGKLNETNIKSNIADALSSSEIKKQNIYTANNKCEIVDTIYGNVFVAGNEINIKSNYIAGDVFLFGNTITIDENAIIDGNVYIAAQQINTNGTIHRSSYMMGKIVKLNESAYIGYDTFICGDTIEVKGEMARNAYIGANILEVKNTALINGNLSYEAREKSEIPEGSVKGRIDFKKIIDDEEDIKEIIFDYVIDMFRNLIFTLVIFIVILLMSRNFTDKAQIAISGKNIFKSLGIGLLGLILVPIMVVLLIVMGVTANVGILLIFAYITTLIIANAITAISISALITSRKTGMKLPLVVPFIAIVLWALESIPYIGTIVSFFSIIIGIGVLLQGAFSKSIE